MISNWKKVMFATLTAIIAIAPFATGCGDKKPAEGNTNINSSSAASGNNAANNSSELAPGIDTEGVLATPSEIQGVSITLDEIYEPSKAPESRNSQFIICKFTLKNNSAEPYTMNSLESFSVFIDSKQDEEALYSNAPLVAASKIGEITVLSGEVASGGTIEGVIGMEVPKDWASLKLVCKPATQTSNDTISYTITDDQIIVKY